MATNEKQFAFPKLKLSLEEGHYCCGHAVVCNVDAVWIGGYIYVGGKHQINKVGFDTHDQMMTDFFNSIDSRLEEGTEEHNHRLSDDETWVGCCYAFMTMTLYRGQHVYGGVDLIDSCVEKGWTVLQEGVNPKTGNRIYNLGKNL